MLDTQQGLWLCANPKLKQFDRPLLQQLHRHAHVRCWNYFQQPDQPCCLDSAVDKLHEYIQQMNYPAHLLGHSLGGVLGLLYARKYPKAVQSLTILSVGVDPKICWHTHYYVLRNLLPCSRSIVLRQMVRLLFGYQSAEDTAALTAMLIQVLDQELTPHALIYQDALASGGVDVPLLVCQGTQDVILDFNSQSQWQNWLKDGDRFWRCPEGRYFFHYDYPCRSSQVIMRFWQQVVERSMPSIAK